MGISLSSSAAGSRPSDLAAPPSALISTELELPVVTIADGSPPIPQVFAGLWADMTQRGWTAGEFCVTRPHPSESLCISSNQAMSTDTGPVIELVASPSRTLAGIASQIAALQAEARSALDRAGCVMLGSGVHPGLRPVPADYYRYRTPRPAYDYAISERGWRHWSIVDKAAVQELVDVSFEDAPRAVRLLHRLTGLMNFVLRNDPGIHGPGLRSSSFGEAGNEGRLSVRSLAWRSHVPRTGPFAGDSRKVVIPETEIDGWRNYLSLLWESAPMFLAGTKNQGQAFVPERPTFLEFLKRAPREGWAGRLLDGSPTRVVPEHAHVAATDWSYMGFARIRWKWRPQPPSVAEIADAWDRGSIEDLLARSLEKVVVENRGTSTQPPGEDLVSLALVTGLLANLDEATELSRSSPYSFWLRLLDESTRLPLRSAVLGRSVPDLAGEMIAIARRGLVSRGEPAPDAWLAPLLQRIEDGASPAERRLQEVRRGGTGELIKNVRMC
jgi:gamma-glutamylcysteine synthetase